MIHRYLVILSLLAAAPPASAQPTPDAIAVAKRHFEQAEAYFKARAFDLAAKEYQAAYDQIREPGLLFNIGLALENHGDFQAAITFYDQFLAAAGTGAKATEAKARRDVLARKLEEQRAAAERAAAERAAAEKLEAERLEAERREAERREAERREAERREAERGDPPSMIPAYVSFGVGAVALGVAIYYGLGARSIGDDVEDDLATGMPPVDTSDGRFDDGAGKALIANVALGTAVVATAVGGFLTYRVLAAKRDAKTITFIPSVDRDRAGAAVEVRW